MNESAKKNLLSPVQYLKGVGPALAKILERLEIRTIRDLIFFVPRTYEDRRNLKPFSQLQPSEYEIVRGTVTTKKVEKTRRGFSLFRATLNDGKGEIEAVWFNQPFLDRALKVGDEVFASGRLSFGVMRRAGRALLELSVREYEKIDSAEAQQTIVPIYALTEGLYQKTIRKIAKYALAEYGFLLEDPLSQELKNQHQLMGRLEALQILHSPSDLIIVENARRRLVFEEFFLFQLGAVARAANIKKQPGQALTVGGARYLGLLDTLPFQLTADQQKVLKEIDADLVRPQPMNRLLMDEVGSGKTIIALLAMLSALDSLSPQGDNFQSAIMAPTEILARQHYHKIKQFLEHEKAPESLRGIKIALLIGSTKTKAKQQILKELAAGEIHILIGTHALIEDRVKFKRLGLVVIDEQHRFGVLQREVLAQKGVYPHLLFLTATPIPRSLSLTLYGDLDVSLLKELPPGRTPIKTHFVTEAKRASAYEFMRQKVKEGSQIYVVCPLIEESEKLDLKAAQEEFRNLSAVFGEYQVALLHGRMKADDKARIMADFVANRVQILVSTTVIEVGVDVPNATLMVIEQAERFGLSQLHQLRGRVGRGAKESFCFLLGEPKTAESKQRLKAVLESNDGFYLAEVDLKLRGPGDYVGTRQAGLPDFKIADLVQNEKELESARIAAREQLALDPELKKPENALLRKEFLERFGKFLKVERLN